MIRWTWANTRKTPKEAQTIIEEWSEWEEGTKWCKWLPACVIIAVSKIYPTIPEERWGWWSDYDLDIGLDDLDISGHSLVEVVNIFHEALKLCYCGNEVVKQMVVNRNWSGRCTYLCNLTPIDIVLHPFGACNALDWYNTHNNAAEEAWYSMLIKCSCKVGCNQSNFNPQPPTPATNSCGI